MLKNGPRKDDILQRLAENSQPTEKKSLSIVPTVTDNGARILQKEDVTLALMEIGLGPKLINQALVGMGFTLQPFTDR